MKGWRRWLCWALLCVFLLALAAPAMARTVPDGTVVYVTDTGECYHRKGCSYLKSSNRTTVEEAEARGYRPCSRCDPDVRTGEYVPKYKFGGGSSGTVRSAPNPSSSASRNPKEDKRESDGSWVLLVFVAVILGAPLLAGGVAGCHTAVKERKEKAEYVKLYSGRTPEELTGVPEDVVFGPDGLPKVRGAQGWGQRFTCYITPNGESYHGTKGCSGARKEVHICQVMGVKKPCAKCHPPTEEDLSWYAEYIRVKEIKRKYKIP